MNNYRFITLLFVTVFAGGAIFHSVVSRLSEDRLKEKALLEVLYPDAEEFSAKQANPPHYKAYKSGKDGKKELIGLAFVTSDLAPEIHGYAGPVKILAGVGPEGDITGLHMISHAETPSYMGGLSEFLTTLSSLNIKSDFTIGRSVDAISRATITSEAIADSLEKGLRLVGHEVLGISVEEPAHATNPVAAGQIIIPFVLFGTAVAALFIKRPLFRKLSLAGGLLFLGVVHGTMYSVVQVANIGLGHFPEFAKAPLWYCLIGLTIITVLLFGNIYCGSICPFASVQEVIYYLFHRRRKTKAAKTNSLILRLRYGKFAVLVGVIALSLVLGKADAAGVEVFLTLFTLNGSRFAWALLILMLAAAAFHYRFWCKYLCPAGALNGLMARLSLWKLRPGENCNDCGACVKVCPTDAISFSPDNKPVIDHAECIVCNKCVSACPKGSLTFSRHYGQKR